MCVCVAELPKINASTIRFSMGFEVRDGVMECVGVSCQDGFRVGMGGFYV